MMAPTQVRWSEVGGQRLMDRSTTVRVELWITVLCLNFALAGVLAMAVVVAHGWGHGQSWWARWLLLGVLLTLCTSRRLCQTLAPLFWLPASARDAQPEAACLPPAHMPESMTSHAIARAGLSWSPLQFPEVGSEHSVMVAGGRGGSSGRQASICIAGRACTFCSHASVVGCSATGAPM